MGDAIGNQGLDILGRHGQHAVEAARRSLEIIGIERVEALFVLGGGVEGGLVIEGAPPPPIMPPPLAKTGAAMPAPTSARPAQIADVRIRFLLPVMAFSHR